MTSVLLVEDEPRTRLRLAKVLEAAPELTLAGVAEDVASGLEAMKRLLPDVLLTDLGLPDGSGIELIAKARGSQPGTHIMVITVLGDERNVLGAISAGAAGYLLKDGTDEEIVQAIAELMAGGSPISPSIARHLLRRFQSRGETNSRAAEESAPALSERERQVLGLVAKGFSSPEIARLLGLSPHTVKTHVRHIYEKLEVSSRGEVVYEALQRGLLPLDE